MRRGNFRNVLVATVSVAALAAGIEAQAAELALRRVLLSTGGVGYFEYEASVTGDAELTLEVRRDQVDDVLKSVVVYDDKGGVGTIRLPGREPLRAVFRDLPFEPEALESPTALLNALRGAEVRATGGREIAGRLVAVTEDVVQLPNGGGTVVRHRVSLLTPEGLRQVVLEDVESLLFTDAKLQAQVDAALAAVARHGARDRRTLTVQTTAPGADPAAARTVRVGYVVEAPLWKTAYRLTLQGDGSAGLQGWAVLENLSGEDWRGVDLTVVSGNPVTFRQALYDAYFVKRPEVPVEVLGRVLPPVDKGAVPAPEAVADEAVGGASAPRAQAMPALPPAPAPMAKSATGGVAAPSASVSERPATATAAESAEATTQVMFHYPRPVDVADGHSLLLPIVDRAVPAERLDLYRRDTHALHPLAAVRLNNDGEAGLPPGILTLYERMPETGAAAYVGDARLDVLPAGESRLLSFAVDPKVRVDPRRDTTQTLTQAKVVDGLLHLTTTERATATYAVAGAAREPRTVVVEHPRQPGWELAAPKPADLELTPTAYRLRATVPAGGTASLSIALERPRQERVDLINLPAERIDVFANAAELPQAIRAAMGKLAGLRAAITGREQAVAKLEREREEIGGDQQRLRDNLDSVPEDSDLQRRYLAKLGAQEDRLERLDTDLAAARGELDAARQALAEYVRGLKL